MKTLIICLIFLGCTSEPSEHSGAARVALGGNSAIVRRSWAGSFALEGGGIGGAAGGPGELEAARGGTRAAAGGPGELEAARGGVGAAAGGPGELALEGGAGGSAGGPGELALERGGTGGSAGSPSSSAVRVQFVGISGTAVDDAIATRVALVNDGPPLALKNLHVQYWAKMAWEKAIDCTCDAAVCSAATLGSWRAGRTQANTCLEYSFPGFTLASGRSIELSFHCSYDDRSAINEVLHYSYPFGAQPGDPLETVTIVYEGRIIWGVEPL